MLKRLVFVLLASAACAPGLCAQGGTANFEQAMDDYEHARYARAEGALRTAAEQGNVRAQEVLGFMYAFGPSLYPGIHYDRHEAVVWFDRAARGGSESARFMFCALTRHAATYRLRSAPCAISGPQGSQQLGRR